MSDAFRKDFHTKLGEKLTPNSTKSTQEKLKESVTDSADRIARGAQPDSSKSTTQSAFDKGQRSSDRTVHGSGPQTIGSKVKDAVGLNRR
ncbi:hypothetical protein MMC07_001410 [Pseudocyphellaria aurata]|nr:hypothetical protein [Pseudocyphellaria aurata]